MAKKKEVTKKNKQVLQSRICDCWLDIGQCFCDIPKQNKDKLLL